MKTLKPRVKVGKKATKTHERPRGNTLYSIMKKTGPRLCAHCQQEGRVGNGDILDHKIPLAIGGTNDPSNLQWLCKHHEKIKTAKERKNFGW